MIPGQSASISPNGNTHLYTGQERDTLPDGSNMDYMHFRFFSSNMGRFQKPDSNFDSPLSNPQGWNLYSYVKGNPVNFNDPTGHETKPPDNNKKVAQGNTVPYAATGAAGSGNPNAHEGDPAGAEAEADGKDKAGQAAPKQPPPAPQPATPPSPQTSTPGQAPSGQAAAPSQGGQQATYSGDATYYNLPGKTTASGSKLDANAMAAAMTSEKVPTLPTDVTVTYVDKDGNKNTVTVTVNDRGPFARDEKGKPLRPLQPDPRGVIDLTPKAFQTLTGGLDQGRVPVVVTVPR
jgi:RHS repeat-associated protein